MAEKKKKTKKVKKNVPHARVYLNCDLNNTLITVTDLDGNVLSRSSAGASGFRGTRKSTPYAAQVAAENAMRDGLLYGIQKVDVFVNGYGVGRDQSLRGVVSSGVDVEIITDTTGVAHGGCRKKKRRRT